MTYMQKVKWKNYSIITGFIFLLIAAIIFYSNKIYNLQSNIRFLILLAIGLILLGMFMQWFFDRIFKKYLDPVANKIINKIKNADKGEKGEDEVCAELEKVLVKGKYLIHRNFMIPGRTFDFDIDAIVVGPKGIIIFEIKNYSNRMAFERNDVHVETPKGFVRIPSKDDPRNEVDYCCDQLSRYLNANGFGKIPVWKAVVFNKPGMAIILSNRIGVYVISGPEQLNKYITGIPIDPRFTPDFCSRINRLLSNR